MADGGQASLVGVLLSHGVEKDSEVLSRFSGPGAAAGADE